MKKKLQKFLAVTAMISIVLVQAGCSGNSAPSANSNTSAADSSSTTPITVTLMDAHSKEAADTGDISALSFRKALDAYTAAHPDVKVDETAMQVDSYETKIQAQAAVNDLPDVFMVKGSWFPNFIDSNLLNDLTTPLANSGWQDKLRENILVNATFDSKVYGLPDQFSSTTIVFYNKELWKKVGYDTLPKTWDELIAAKSKFDALGVSTIAFGNKDKWPVNSSYLSAIGDRFTGTDWTKSIISKDGKAKFTDPDFVSALTLLDKLGKSGVFNADYNSIGNQQADALFAAGKAATVIDGYWAASNIEKAAAQGFSDKVALAPLPTVDGAKGAADAVAGGGGWFIGVNSSLTGDRLKAAQDLALALCGEERSKFSEQDYGQVAAVKVDNVDYSKFSKLTKDLSEMQNNSTAIPIYDANMPASVIDVMNNGIQEIFNGSKAPAQVAAEVQKEYETVIKNK